MKNYVYGLIVLLALVAAPDSFALRNDWGGMEDDWTMPTGTGSGGPTPMLCTAAAGKGQMCRACYPQYDDWGRETGLIVCAAVKTNSSCSCDYPKGKCSGVGSCTYVY